MSKDFFAPTIQGHFQRDDPLNLVHESAAEKRARAQSQQQIELAQAEEARRTALRARIAQMFGEGPDTEQVQIGMTPETLIGRGRGGPSSSQPIYEERPTLAAAARKQFANEDTALSTALRGQYGDELKKSYEEGQRQLRFGAARTGNIGSSIYADRLASGEEQNRMGGTRIDDAVQRALANLRSSRETSKLRGLDLINAGTGEEGVQSAASGLKSALSTAQSQNRENLFGDLFTDTAFGVSNKAAGDRNAAAIARFTQGRRGGLSSPGASSSPQIVKY